jgi:hypothetical protein
MSSVYLYVVDRDFGFAPNPFHGCCTLATCKPAIRSTAATGDWVFGMGGSRLDATGRCVFAMQITKKLSFDEYWSDSRYAVKKPVRNGSRTMLVGDNIYHRDSKSAAPDVPEQILKAIGYKNVRSHRRIDQVIAQPLIDWVLSESGGTMNVLAGYPFDFENSALRYSVADNRVR